jgi:hypothetical protein
MSKPLNTKSNAGLLAKQHYVLADIPIKMRIMWQCMMSYDDVKVRTSFITDCV